MKKLIIASFLACLGIFLQAQGLEKLIVEKYYVSNAADAAWQDSNEPGNPLPEGSVTWRFYVDMAPGYKLGMVFGNTNHETSLSTATSFFNNQDYGSQVPSFSALNAKKGTVMLDSWVTMGSASAGHWGILKSEDTDGSIGNSNSILQNDNPFAEIPLTQADGLITGTGLPEASFIGDVPFSIFNDGTPNNTNFHFADGAYYFLGGVTGPTSENRVLIAQVTTNGIVNYNFNIQVNDASGNGYTYVSGNPVNDEIFDASYNLSGTLNPAKIAPKVNITSPANGATVHTGEAVNLQANATDLDGTISSVEFFINGISAGVDNSGNQSSAVQWIPTETGSVEITAVAIDNDLISTTSEIVTLNVEYPLVSKPVENAEITIYPNPSDGRFNVVSPKEARLTVTDINGKELILDTEIAANQRKEINLSGLANGTYLVKIQNSNSVKVQMLMINK